MPSSTFRHHRFALMLVALLSAGPALAINRAIRCPLPALGRRLAARAHADYAPVLQRGLTAAGFDAERAGQLAHRILLAPNAARGRNALWEQLRREIIDSYADRLSQRGAPARIALEEMVRRLDRLKQEIANTESELADQAILAGDRDAYNRHIAKMNHWNRLRLREFMGWQETPPPRRLENHFNAFYTEYRQQQIEARLKQENASPVVEAYFRQQLSFVDETNPYRATHASVLNAAEAVLKDAKIKYQRVRRDGREVLLIAASGHAGLNRFGGAIERTQPGVEVIYDPSALDNPRNHNGGGAFFDSTHRRLILPHEAIGLAHLDALTLHEVMHGRSDAFWRAGKVNRFRGTLWRVRGTAKSGIYDNAMEVEELATNAHTLAYRMVELQQALRKTPPASIGEMRTAVWVAYQTARSCEHLGRHATRLFDQALKHLQDHPTALRIVQEPGPIAGSIATSGELAFGNFHLKLTLAVGRGGLNKNDLQKSFVTRVQELRDYAGSLQTNAGQLMWDMKSPVMEVRAGGDDAKYREIAEANLARWLETALRPRNAMNDPLTTDVNLAQP